MVYFVSLFCPKDSTIDSIKTFKTQEWLVVGCCSTYNWIAFSMLYWLVYVISSHLDELISAWRVYSILAFEFESPKKVSISLFYLYFFFLVRRNGKQSSKRNIDSLSKSCGCKYEIHTICHIIQANIYLFKVNNTSNRKRIDKYSKLAIKTMTSFCCLYCYLGTYIATSSNASIVDFQ